MTNSLRLRSLLAVGVSAAAMIAVASPALAQSTATGAAKGATTAQSNTIEELVVTAQKKEEALQDVPIAVSAFSQDSLEKQKIDGGPNLVLAIPNVNFSKGNFTGYNFQIRGVGSKLVAASGDAGTGIHLNNAPLTSNNLFDSEFYDVERVEVLRGPQGTLYGRNATGGVVNIITAKPVDRFEANARVEVGNYGARKFRGMINVPVGDMLAVRLAGTSLKRDGFGKNTVTGNDADDRDLYGLRASVAFTPADTLKMTFVYDKFHEDDNRSRIGKQFCTKDPGPANIGGVAYSAAAGGLIGQIERGFFSQGCLPSKADSNALGTPNSQGTLGGLYGALTGLQTGDAFAGKMQDPNIRNIESVIDPIYRSNTDIFEYNLDWDLTDSLKFTALTSYTKYDLFTKQDYNRVAPTTTFNTSPNPVNAFAALGATYGLLYSSLFPGGVVTDAQTGNFNKFVTLDISSAMTKQFTQELRVQSSFAGPWNFNIGGIYVDYKATGDYYVFFNTGTAYSQMTDRVTNLSSGGAVPYPCPQNNANCVYVDTNANPDRSGHNYYDSYGPYHLKSKAAFGELYYQMSDTFKWTLGLRYTDDTKLVENHPVALSTNGSGVAPAAAGTLPIQRVRFQETTGRFGFDWKPQLDFTNDTLVYAFYSKGYKAGGVNPPCSLSVGCPSPSFAPEFVNAMEVGTKNTLAGGSVLLNLTAFHYKYEGYQVSKIVNRTSVNENIDATIKGLEFESVWQPVRPLRFNLNVGYLDTHIDGGSSIDSFNRTQGDPNLVVVKSSSASNCVVTLNQARAALTTANGLGNPFALLQLCAGAFQAVDGVAPSDGVAVNLAGKELPNAPHWTASLGAQYTMDLGPDWNAVLRADYYKQTDTFSRIYNSAADRIDGWQNVNATLVISNPANGWSFELYGKNLTNEKALTDTYLTDDSSGLFRNGFYTDPKTYGVAVSKKW